MGYATCHCGKCQTCTHRVYMREYSQRPEVRERRLLVQKRYYTRMMQDPAYVAKERERGREKFRNTPKEITNARTRAWRKRTGWKPTGPGREATTALNNALKCGRVEKAKSCERCGDDRNLQGHHADYSKPLEVEWICSRCHGVEHRR